MSTSNNARLITDLDYRKLSALMEAGSASRQFDADPLEKLDDLLASAIIIPAPDMAPDIATMESQLLFEDRTAKQRFSLRLVYPEYANSRDASVSVLSPVGLGLLGCQAGADSQALLANGQKREIHLVRVLQASADSTEPVSGSGRP